MSLLGSLFKLEKLTVTAYKTAARSGFGTRFEAMFNPSSYSQSYAIEWKRRQGINDSGAELQYILSEPSELSLNLVFDGTGVDQIGLFSFTSQTVAARIQDFLDVAYTYQGSLHEPAYLVAEWGELSFSCRLSNVDIKYTAFDRDGTPLRAELAVTFVSDETAGKRAKRDGKTSPDLTHVRIVRHGDTLPLLVKAIYGSADRYLDVARFNQLDDFRNLQPGRQLLFPPLVNLPRGHSKTGGS
ncbi:MAG: hypothetical protein JNJ46_25560 [Myxococcales bacterium]|nr:hypothetical protein [Myxococcales bacterium]